MPGPRLIYHTRPDGNGLRITGELSSPIPGISGKFFASVWAKGDA